MPLIFPENFPEQFGPDITEDEARQSLLDAGISPPPGLPAFLAELNGGGGFDWDVVSNRVQADSVVFAGIGYVNFDLISATRNFSHEHLTRGQVVIARDGGGNLFSLNSAGMVEFYEAEADTSVPVFSNLEELVAALVHVPTPEREPTIWDTGDLDALAPLLADDPEEAYFLAAADRADLVPFLLQEYGPLAPNLLVVAASSGSRAFVAALLDNGVDVNVLDEDRFTAIAGACRQSDREMIEFLMSRGGDPTIPYDGGGTPWTLSGSRSFEIWYKQKVAEFAGG